MKINLGPKKSSASQQLSGDNVGKSMSPPSFQLKAGKEAPIQRQKVKVSDQETIDTKQYSKRELESLMVKMEFSGNSKAAKQLKTALENGDYENDFERETMVGDFWRQFGEDKEIKDDPNDGDYSSLVAESEGLHLMMGGIEFAKKQKEKRKKPMPLNKVKGEMFELAFDKMQEESQEDNISTNEFVSNCPGIDHMSSFGDRFFEQSKAYTSGSLDKITDTYLDTYSKSGEMGSLLFNKGSKGDKRGKGIRKMFQDSQKMEGFGKSNRKFSKKVGREMLSNKKQGEYDGFDSTEDHVKEFKKRFYMQVPSDVYEKMIKRGEDLDGFYPSDLSLGNMREFERYCNENGYTMGSGEIKEAKRKRDTEGDDYVDEPVKKNRKKRKKDTHQNIDEEIKPRKRIARKAKKFPKKYNF